MQVASNPCTNLEIWLAGIQVGVDDGPLDERLVAILGDDERARLDATASGPMRRQRLAGYALRRAALGRALGVEPREVRMRLDDEGLPAIEGAPGLAVGIAHSDGLAACALARRRRVGVDVERVRPRRDVVRFARRCFDPGEADELAAAPADDRLRAFFRLWTAKESFAKASGRDLLEVLPRRVRSEGRWRVIPLEMPDGYVGAVTVGDVPEGETLVYEMNVVERGEI